MYKKEKRGRKGKDKDKDKGKGLKLLQTSLGSRTLEQWHFRLLSSPHRSTYHSLICNDVDVYHILYIVHCTLGEGGREMEKREDRGEITFMNLTYAKTFQ